MAIKINWHTLINFLWVAGLFLIGHDFFWHYAAFDECFSCAILDLLTDFLRWPPHHFWIGVFVFVPSFLVDILVVHPRERIKEEAQRNAMMAIRVVKATAENIFGKVLAEYLLNDLEKGKKQETKDERDKSGED